MEVTQVDRDAIQAVIGRQLAAFQQGDADGAFACASPGIQAQFGNSDAFIAMVKSGYQPVYRPRSVLFTGMTTLLDCPAQKMILMDSEGDLIMAIYQMEKQPSGEWRIHGCFLTSIEEQPEDS
jgi:hypothetical protein